MSLWKKKNGKRGNEKPEEKSNKFVDDRSSQPSISQATATTASSLTSRRSSISFGSVKVHTHKVILGDNPSVKSGLPITLDWQNVKSERFVHVDEYEKRGRPPRTSKKAVRIPKEEREAMLRCQGYSTDRLCTVSKEISNIKTKNKETLTEVARLKKTTGSFRAAARELCRLEDLGQSQQASYSETAQKQKARELEAEKAKKAARRAKEKEARDARREREQHYSRIIEYREHTKRSQKRKEENPKTKTIDIAKAEEKSLSLGDYFEHVRASGKFKRAPPATLGGSDSASLAVPAAERRATVSA